MIYRAYILHPASQRVEDKTTTYFPSVAEAAFRLLLHRWRARLYIPGAVAILNGRRGPGGRDIVRLEAVELDGSVDPAMQVRLHPPGESLQLAIPATLAWPVTGRDLATGHVQLMIDEVRREDGLDGNN